MFILFVCLNDYLPLSTSILNLLEQFFPRFPWPFCIPLSYQILPLFLPVDKTRNETKSLAECVIILLRRVIYMQCFKPLPINLGPLVQRTTSPNTRLNFNPGFFIPLCKSSFGIIYFTPLRASTSNHQIVNKKKLY